MMKTCLLASVCVGLAAATTAASAEMIFIPDANTDRVLKFNAEDGTYKGMLDPLVTSPNGILVDAEMGPDGLLYCLIYDNGAGQINRVDPVDGTYKGSLAGGGFLSFPYSLEVGEDGTAYVSQFQGGVLKFEAATGTYKGTLGTGFWSSTWPAGLALEDSTGILYVTNNSVSGSANVLKFEAATGTYKGAIGTGFAGSSGFYGLEVSTDGMLYAVAGDTSGSGTYKVLRFETATGTYKGALATGFYQGGNGGGIAISSANQLYLPNLTSVNQWCSFRFDAADGTYRGHLGFGFFTFTYGIAMERQLAASGKVILDQYDPGHYTGTPLAYEIRDNVTNEILGSGNTTVIDAAGNYKISGLTQNRTVRVRIKCDKWLAKITAPIVAGTGPITVPTLTLLGGDSNNDNSVDLLDYFDLSDSYNLVLGDSGYNPQADFNGDDSVDLLDYFILSDNYNLVGDDF